MRVLVHASGFDTGGQGYRIREAFATHEPDWHVDALSIMANPFGYPDQYAKIGGIKRRLLVPELYRMADVVHLRNSLAAVIPRQDKPLILHHHGSAFRMTHARLAREAEKVGAVQVASTLDLTLLEPDVEWCPVPYSLDTLWAMRNGAPGIAPGGIHPASPDGYAPYPVGTTDPSISYSPHPGGIVRIAHFPTAVKIKSSAVVKAAVEGLPVEFVSNLDPKARVARRMDWQRVLAEKARSDIYVDQLILGYGNNAVEAWAMGLPVVAGVADRTVREVMLDRFGQLPFVEATVETLPSVLRRLVDSPSMRAEYGAIGRQHVERWHSGAETVAVLRDAYQRAGLRQLRAVA